MNSVATLERWCRCAGTWRGVNRLQDPHTGSPDESPATATLTPLLRGTFVRIDYTWEYHGQAQEGSVLFGAPDPEEVTAHWIDTWHMGRMAMACRGRDASDGTLSVKGSYACPPGPDWGWRITVCCAEDGRQLRMVMHNITPEGEEQPAAEAEFVR